MITVHCVFSYDYDEAPELLGVFFRKKRADALASATPDAYSYPFKLGSLSKELRERIKKQIELRRNAKEVPLIQDPLKIGSARNTPQEQEFIESYFAFGEIVATGICKHCGEKITLYHDRSAWAHNDIKWGSSLVTQKDYNGGYFCTKERDTHAEPVEPVEV